MPIQSLDALLDSCEIARKRVFVRADLNVPLSASGQIADDSRIRASIPTLARLIEAGARIVLASHLGRPKGERRPELSLAVVCEALVTALDTRVHFVEDCIGETVRAAAASLENGEVLLLENLRFHAAETENDPDFARALAQGADLYVNDAFGTAHRAHASTAGMVEYVPRAAAGLLLQRELDALAAALEPERPFVCFLGGAKVSDKLGVLEALIERADTIGVGGAMAYTFLAARGEAVGDSLVELDRLEDARRMMARARERGCDFLLPTDHVVSDRIEEGAQGRVIETIPDGLLGVDIGPKSTSRYAEAAASARTLLWNGPMGVFEIDAFALGTEGVAQAVAASSARSIVGGGDSLAAVHKAGVGDRIGHLSTGGGASLEFLQGLQLPGVAALDRPS
ncbi:MAG: phosphoglycerate kinase [bacterium]|nr:phosphoglycerate kinase [bacterium]